MGLPVGRTKVAVYAISGLCAAIAGLLFSVYMLSGYGLHAVGMELDAIAAVVIGGTLLSGGVGYVLGSLLGVLVLGVIQTLISFQGTLSSWWTKIAIGTLLLLFIVMQRSSRGGRRERHGGACARSCRRRSARRACRTRPSRVSSTAPRASGPRRGSGSLQAIERLGYRPNTAARALVRGRSAIIGIITTASTLFGPTSVHRTVNSAAREAGFFASSVSLAEMTREGFDDAVDHLDRLAVEGIVVIAGHDEALEVARSRSAKMPFVIVEGDLTRARRTVGVDNVAGARLATRHLLDLGHVEIAHVTGPLDWAEARARADGWRTEMLAAGHRPARADQRRLERRERLSRRSCSLPRCPR